MWASRVSAAAPGRRGGGGGAAARRAHVWPARASAATLLHCTCIACPHELAVDKATILNLDRLGMNVACERQGQSFKARLPFPRPAADRKSIKVCSGRGARHAAAPPPCPHRVLPAIMRAGADCGDDARGGRGAAEGLRESRRMRVLRAPTFPHPLASARRRQHLQHTTAAAAATRAQPPSSSK